LSELKTIYSKYPKLWDDIKQMDKLSHRQFRSDYSLQELEQKFKKEIQAENEQIKFSFV
jgi:hypothetical protein